MATAAPARLTVGTAVHDDYDGAYFTLLSLRLHHPEVADRVDLLLVDGDPDGPTSAGLRAMEGTVPGLRYVPVGHVRGTALRDLVFREARTEWVLCVDSHVLLAPGALARLLAYADEHPQSRDLLQGPLLGDDLRTMRTHLDPVFDGTSFGTWGCDPRGADPDAPPFEIGMQGLGLFACRKEVWPGFNPRLRGQGAEEGYLHKKFRAAGARALCLPFLRWTRRTVRPHGTALPADTADRCRDHLLAWEEAGMAVEPVLDHYRERCGDIVDSWLADHAAERSHPLDHFDALVCVNADAEPHRWVAANRRFRRLGIAGRVRRLPAAAVPGDPSAAHALSHRTAVAQARQQELRHVLVFEDDVVFCHDASSVLRAHVAELADRRWTVCRFGGSAVAYHARAFERLLAELPSDEAGMRAWSAGHGGLEQFCARQFGDTLVRVSPAVTSRERADLAAVSATHRAAGARMG
ncbi:glycosyltransferase [Streptomyces sp. I05A-00742]|uniref:glycosyltransferase n=1 Tax=Streptomyces sp. I05A-00742 TaxID=2732853 RepID=UPI001489E827|nr:glycosyltransferase [Streptomyces sp. I05A-00742]